MAKRYPCPHCDRDFALPGHLGRHMKAKHPAPPDQGNPKQNESDKKKTEKIDPRAVNTITKEAAAKSTTGELECPFCKAKYKSQSALHVHIQNKHKTEANLTSHNLIKVLESKKTVSDMLVAVSEWIQSGNMYSETLPVQVVNFLRKEDARLQLALRMIAILKVQRVLDLNTKVTDLDSLYREKMNKPEWRDQVDLDELARRIDFLHNNMRDELAFLKEISQLNQIDLAGVIDKLTQAFGTAAFDGKATGVVNTPSGVRLPESAPERELLRRLITNLALDDYVDELGGGASEITAESETDNDGNS